MTKSIQNLVSGCFIKRRTNRVPKTLWSLGALIVLLTWLASTPRAHAVCQNGCAGDNTFLGNDALINGFYSVDNTAVGYEALSANDFGEDNTATGAYALSMNVGNGEGTEGQANTADGAYALYQNVYGSGNTAMGESALNADFTGSGNTGLGAGALYSNTTANYNTAIGEDALELNTLGYQNTAVGTASLSGNTSGNRNAALGHSALVKNQTGGYNTAVGFQALNSNLAGSNNVAVGFNAGNAITGSGNVDIGFNVFGVKGESNTTRIGGIYYSVASGRPVYIDSDNKIGTLVSSRRFKDRIEPMKDSSKVILALKPVSFYYKKEVEPHSGKLFGLVAEDVEKVDPELVTHDQSGAPETVRYEAVNAMLLNEFLKEHRQVSEQAAEIEQLKTAVATLKGAMKEQAEQIEKIALSSQNSEDGPRIAAGTTTSK